MSASKTSTAVIDKKDIVPILLIIGAILFGYHEIFNGADFFVHQDQFLVSNLTYGHSNGNGWRPDKGFGISAFYGDSSPHPWAIFSFWEEIFHSQKLAYASSILLLDLIAGITVYFFLKFIAPRLGRSVWLLCPLIIFAPQQAGIHFLRGGAGIAMAPLFLLVLYQYYSRPKYQHFFYFALILWFSFLFGSFSYLSTLLSVGFFFSATYYLYFKEPLREMVVKFLLLFSIGVGITILLGFYIFYSTLIETALIGYTREKVSVIPQEFDLIPDIKRLISFLFGFFQIDWLSHDMEIRGPLYYVNFAYNIVALFPFLFIFFLIRRASSFWEFSLKGLLLVFWIHLVLTCIPLYNTLYSYISMKSMLVINVFDFIGVYPAQIGLLAIFLSEMKKEDLQVSSYRSQILIKWVGSVLFMLYAGLFVFSVLAILLPNVLPTVVMLGVELFSPNIVGAFSRDFIATYAFDYMHVIQSSMHWYSLIFFLLSALFMLLFMRDKWRVIFVNKPRLFAGLMLISAITMSWTASPLNKKKLVWEEAALALPKFEATDRLYYVRDDNSQLSTLDAYGQRLEKAGGREEYYKLRYGYEESPALKLHGHKSFTQEDVAGFIYHIFNGDGVKRLIHLRSLTAGPLISSELLDMGAVSYYYSDRELQSVPEYLSLYFKSKWLYVYKNLNTWPYFYLAERLDIKEEGKHLKNVKRGTAYLSEDDYFDLQENTGSSEIKLKDFSFGKMIFDFSSKNEEFLVVADAWHPFWKANAGDTNLPVVKANEIFKGVRLPKGKYELTLFFDTSPYMVGVYISFVSWVLFISGLLWVYFRSRRESLMKTDDISLEKIK